MKIKFIIYLILLFLLQCVNSIAQNYNQSNAEIGGFLQRMYNEEPFEGVKVFTDYENTFLLSAVSLSPNNYSSPSAMNRVASVKASSQASKFFNGAQITSECIIRSVKKPNKKIETTIEEIINENAVGYISMLQLITCFNSGHNKIFIYGKKIETTSSSKTPKGRK